MRVKAGNSKLKLATGALVEQALCLSVFSFLCMYMYSSVFSSLTDYRVG